MIVIVHFFTNMPSVVFRIILLKTDVSLFFCAIVFAYSRVFLWLFITGAVLAKEQEEHNVRVDVSGRGSEQKLGIPLGW